MLVGVPKEIKDSEYRVGLVPSTAGELIANGHRVIIEHSAGVGAGLGDADYEAVGAEIVPSADEIYARAELVVKVKEPLAQERKKLRQEQVLFTYLHLAADRAQTNDLLASGAVAIAYETVTSPQGALPLLTPMSEVAGRMAPHVGARCLEKEGAAPHLQPARHAHTHGVLDRRRDLHALPPRRSGDRISAYSRGQGTQAHHGGDGQSDESRSRHRRYRHRSGRVCRHLPSDHALGTDLHRG
jgi:hypothetical protein